MLWVVRPAGWRDWMDLHKNARTCSASRAVLMERVLALGWPVKEATEAQGLSERATYRRPPEPEIRTDRTTDTRPGRVDRRSLRN
jgi:hypothetical protein